MSEHRGQGRPALPPDEPETFDRDINLKAIAYTVAGLAGLVALSMVLMWWMAAGLRDLEARRDPPARPIPEAAGRQLPPAPRLQGAPGSAFEEAQGSPELELRQMRAEEERQLTTYEWVDETAGTARIPVARAIEILAERGLPEAVASEPASPAAADGTAPEEAPSGGGDG